ncbi:MAG: DUF2330 domain-containing protein [Xenococcaceae cyanobacterium MO_188.B29]|nr:DUF2330 domain-containing protein [Xenococcaceae cyanobacterium MO_188.B29]
MKPLRILWSCFLAITIFMVGMQPAQAFCGFYVAKADTNLYNQASQVIISRDGERTVLTMANDYQGEVKDFALVVPVPVILKEEQVHVGNPKILSRLDSFSAPRLVEYFDSNPCEIRAFDEDIMFKTAPQAASMESGLRQERSLGVTIEEQFTVGEYDILILSAKESDGLETWLTHNGYKIPPGAKEILQPYIRQNMKFFVAKVNLTEYDQQGFKKLRPISIAYESPKYMLPIRLGMVNAKQEQDLIVYLLSPQGQTELTNYRTVKVPSDRDIPEFVKAEFKNFYTSMFQKSYERENKQVAFLEYAWDMGSCDPCSAEPLNREELKQAGVFWLNSSSRNLRSPRNNVFITRLHVRYTGDKFPEDLKFQATGNRQLFQGRYVIRHPYTGEMNCSAANEYKRSVRDRQEREVQTLASLTGWNINDIRNKVEFVESQPIPWWRTLWNQ